ncbi:MAG TPA: M23 family metallopeptidase [Bacteroidales bacterium]|nr:M23 family metallopeptidase [Bacteroidales bacterium]
MVKDEKKKKKNWRDKYRFSIVNDHTFEEVWRIRLTQYNAFLLITALIFFMIAGTIALISFTNLREFIPGYPDVEMRRNILLSAIRLDSLNQELVLRDKYFNNLNAIIAGNIQQENYGSPDTTKNYKKINFTITPEETALKAKVEKEEKFNLTLRTSVSSESSFSFAGLHFFPPVKGVVSGKYDVRTKHFGTDIVTSPKAIVSSALDGTVVFTGWTMETGFVIEVQHQNNIITVYKHNSSLLKETGDLVRAGEGISVVGDSGELYTSGPHLHFEIWYKGSSLDPEKNISF